jgi:hypothetical protein
MKLDVIISQPLGGRRSRGEFVLSFHTVLLYVGRLTKQWNVGGIYLCPMDTFINQVFNENRVIVMPKSASRYQLLVSAQ